MGKKVDFKKEFKEFYNPQKSNFHIVNVPLMNYLKVDGKGDPNLSVDYQQAIEALYSMSYGIKFALKPQGIEYIVPPLEGLWWMENMDEFTLANKYRWEWTMMIMQPEAVTADLVEKIRDQVYKKKRISIIKKVRFEPLDEGLSVQILYTGPYIDEAATITAMHEFIINNGYQTQGKHHEIYLGDPRKTSQEKLQTILRQPILTI